MVLKVNILLHHGRLVLITHVHFFTLLHVLHHCVILRRALGVSAHLYQYSQVFLSTMAEPVSHAPINSKRILRTCSPVVFICNWHKAKCNQVLML